MVRFYRTRRNWFLGYIVLSLTAAPLAAGSGPPVYHAKVLHRFCAVCAYGEAPYAGLIRELVGKPLWDDLRRRRLLSWGHGVRVDTQRGQDRVDVIGAIWLLRRAGLP